MSFTDREYVDLPDSEQRAYLPPFLSSDWVQHRSTPAFAFANNGLGDLRGVVVFFSVGLEEDGERWIHVSLSREGRTPSWEDTLAVKRVFIGDDRYAVQVLPPLKEHYTAPPGPRKLGVLHLWARADGKAVTPNFLRARGGTL